MRHNLKRVIAWVLGSASVLIIVGSWGFIVFMAGRKVLTLLGL